MSHAQISVDTVLSICKAVCKSIFSTRDEIDSRHRTEGVVKYNSRWWIRLRKKKVTSVHDPEFIEWLKEYHTVGWVCDYPSQYGYHVISEAVKLQELAKHSGSGFVTVDADTWSLLLRWSNEKDVKEATEKVLSQ